MVHQPEGRLLAGGHQHLEAALPEGPVGQDPGRPRAAGEGVVGFQQGEQQAFLLGGGEGQQLHRLRVEAGRQSIGLVEQEGHPTGHAGGHVAAGAAEHHHHASCHVFAAVVAGALHHGAGPAVAHGEALPGAAEGEEFTAGGAVEAGVAEDHLAAGIAAAGRGHDGDAPPVDALAHVVVGLTHQAQVHALQHEGTEALAGRAREGEGESALEAGVAVAGGDLTGQAGAHTAVGVDDRQLAHHVTMALDRRANLRIGEQVVLEDRTVAVGLGLMPQPGAVGGGGDRIQQAGEIQGTGLGGRDGAGSQQLGAADQILQTGHPEHTEQLAHLLGDEEEEVDHVLRQAGEALAQGLLLGGDPHRAVVGVADAGHDAALGDHGDRAEAELLGPQQGRDHHVPAALEAPVGPQQHPVAQAVLQQTAMHLGETQLPGAAGVLDRTQRRGAGAAVMARDLDHVGIGLRHPGGDRADADLGHQLHRHLGGGVDLMQVVDELGQILDRIDVVVRGR